MGFPRLLLPGILNLARAWVTVCFPREAVGSLVAGGQLGGMGVGGAGGGRVLLTFGEGFCPGRDLHRENEPQLPSSTRHWVLGHLFPRR